MSALKNIIVLGLNHRNAPVEVRERFAIPAVEIIPSLNELTKKETIQEAVILSTCNRVEIYAICTNIEKALETIFNFYEGRSLMDAAEKEKFYFHEFPTSVQHLYEVCSGLDSMVVGETEIFGQVKEFYKVAFRAERTAALLNKLFQTAFFVAKETRSQTRIGMGSVSVGSVAVDLASQIFSSLKDRAVMLMGAGEVSETTARALQSHGVRSLMIANRSYDRALSLAKKLGGSAIEWGQWHECCSQVDIIISSTAAPHFVITRQELVPLLSQRKGAPLFLIDIAVPRNIEREINELNGVYLYDIDDLQVIADQNLAMRQKEIALCKQIIRDHVDRFQNWFLNYCSHSAATEAGQKMEHLNKAPTFKKLPI